MIKNYYILNKDLIIPYINKTIRKIKKVKNKIFSYPINKYDSEYQNKYWQIRRKSNSKAKPNNFQIKRAKLFSENILNIDKTLFDIGSGDGTQFSK